MKIVKTAVVPGDLLSFDKLEQGQVFRLVTGKAFYVKVRIRHQDGEKVYKMMELASGDVFPPSKSDCEVFDATVTIGDYHA